MIGAFTWGAGGQAVPSEETMRRRARLSEILLGSALQGGRPQHWSDGIARGVNILAAGYLDKQNRDAENSGKQALAGERATLLGLDAQASSPPPAGLVPVSQKPKNPLLGSVGTPPGNLNPPQGAGMQPVMTDAIAAFAEAFPEMKGRITSGYRDPKHNASVGGASGSRHIHGDAIDFSVRDLPEEKQQAIANWWRARGAGGFGYYPQKGAMHVDFGAQRAWGPNYSKTSLPDTPQWFQQFAAGTPVQVAGPAQAAPAAPQPPQEPNLAERSLGMMRRNALGVDAGAGSGSDQAPVAINAPMPPQRPAMAPQPAPQAAPPPQPGGISQKRLRSAYTILNSPFAGPADKAVAQMVIQKAMTAETKTPAQIEAEQLGLQELRAKVGMLPGQAEAQRLAIEQARKANARVDIETMQAPDGTVFEREKGNPASQWKITNRLPQKPEDRTAYQRELDQVNAERKAANLPPLRLEEYKAQQARAGATQINNDITGGSSKQVFDEFKERATAARAAATGLASIAEARKAVEAGGFFGASADAKLAFNKLGTMLGYENDRVTNTETFRAAIAPQVAAMLKATVGTTQISNADREFAEKAAGGSISLDEKTIKRLLGIMEKGNKAILDEHKEMIDAVYPETEDKKFARERAMFSVRQKPAPTPDPPQDASARRTVNGKTYEKRGNDWYEVQ